MLARDPSTGLYTGWIIKPLSQDSIVESMRFYSWRDCPPGIWYPNDNRMGYFVESKVGDEERHPMHPAVFATRQEAEEESLLRLRERVAALQRCIDRKIDILVENNP